MSGVPWLWPPPVRGATSGVPGPAGPAGAPGGVYGVDPTTTDGELIVSGLQVQAQVGGTFDPLTAIAPRNYWRANQAVLGAGVVTSCPDLGRIPLTMLPGVGMPVNVDALGNSYFAPNQTTQYLKAGIATDWTWLSNGTPWTIMFIAAYPSHPAAAPIVIASYDGGGANGGFLMNTQVNTGNWGPRALIAKSGVGVALDLNIRSLTAGSVHAVCVRMQPNDSAAGTFPIINNRGEIHADGVMQQYLPSNTASVAAFSPAAPTGNGLYMFASTTPANFSGIQLREILLQDSLVPDRIVNQYFQWAHDKFGTPS